MGKWSRALVISGRSTCYTRPTWAASPRGRRHLLPSPRSASGARRPRKGRGALHDAFTGHVRHRTHFPPGPGGPGPAELLLGLPEHQMGPRAGVRPRPTAGGKAPNAVPRLGRRWPRPSPLPDDTVQADESQQDAGEKSGRHSSLRARRLKPSRPGSAMRCRTGRHSPFGVKGYSCFTLPLAIRSQAGAAGRP
jgi:hypothetical protein